MSKRTRYTLEFKRQAVELLENRDKPAVELARDLGVRQNQLYKWREELMKKGDQAFKGPGRPLKEQQSEVSRLKQENKRLKEELEIIKKPPSTLRKSIREICFYQGTGVAVQRETAL